MNASEESNLPRRQAGPKENSPSLSQVKIEVSGQVIGVFYRVWAQKEAIAEHVTGYARNTANKTVEIVAEGEKDNLERFIHLCNTGPEGAVVEKVDVDWQTATGEYQNFEIR